MIPLPQSIIDQLSVIGSLETALANKGKLTSNNIDKLFNKLKSFLYVYRKPFKHSQFVFFVDEIIESYNLNKIGIETPSEYFPRPKKVIDLVEIINLADSQILKSEIPYHFNRAFCLLNHNYEKFLRFDHWTQYNSDEYYVYKYHFRYHGDEEEFEGAIKIFSQIINANNNLYTPYLFRALANNHLNKFSDDRIESDLSRAKFLSSKQYVVNNAMAYFCMNLGDRDKAYRILEETVIKWPKYSTTYINLGILKMDDSPYDEAIEYFQRAIRINPAISADANYLIGLQYLNKNQYKYLDLAIDYLIKARNIDTSHYEAEFLRLECESSKGIISLFNRNVEVTKYNYKRLRNGFYNT